MNGHWQVRIGDQEYDSKPIAYHQVQARMATLVHHGWDVISVGQTSEYQTFSLPEAPEEPRIIRVARVTLWRGGVVMVVTWISEWDKHYLIKFRHAVEYGPLSVSWSYIERGLVTTDGWPQPPGKNYRIAASVRLEDDVCAVTEFNGRKFYLVKRIVLS